MNLPLLISQTRGRIEGWLAQHEAPVILWSGGKDSMVMLHLIHWEMELELPVMLYREPFAPHKYKFHDEIIAQWHLTCYTPWPIASMAYEPVEGGLVLVARYPLRGQGMIDVPKDVIEYDPAVTFSHSVAVCGRDVLDRPKAASEIPFDLALVGHKDVDVDPVLGNIPLVSHYHADPTGTALAYPLKDWTDADVWEYLQTYDVSMDVARYDVPARRNEPSRTYNADYIHACTRCLTVGAADSVMCPKYQRDVPGISHRILWLDRLARPELFVAEKAEPADAALCAPDSSQS